MSAFRRIALQGAHRPHGTTWALARGVLHAARPDPASPGLVRGLEREAAFHLGAAHAVAFGGPAVALEAVLGALTSTPGAEVIVPALAAPWIPAAVAAAGLTAVWADVAPDTLHLDPATLRRARTSRTVAAIAVHTAGVPCDLHALAAATEGLALVEDFGPALGARWRTCPVGALGAAGVAALDAARAASAFGGALACTQDDALSARLRASAAALPEPAPARIAARIAAGNLRALRAHPRIAAFVPPPPAAARRLFGGPEAQRTRMHPSQAEAARSGLFALAAHLDAVRERAATLRHGLPPDAWRQGVPDGALPAWSRLLVRSRDPLACAAAAARAGVEIDPRPLVDLSGGACEQAARAARGCAAVPCHPGLGERDLARVMEAVAGWVE